MENEIPSSELKEMFQSQVLLDSGNIAKNKKMLESMESITKRWNQLQSDPPCKFHNCDSNELHMKFYPDETRSTFVQPSNEPDQNLK